MNEIQKQSAQQVQQQQAKPPTLQALTLRMKAQIAMALPEHVKPERMLRITLTALSKTPKLCLCTQESFLGALMNSAQLGLEPNTPLGMAYLIPYRNTKLNVTECQFQMGYKGMLDIAYRSKEYKMISADIVKENDEFSFEKGLDKKLVHKPKLINAGKPIAYYAVYRTVTDGYDFEVMSVEDVEEHRIKFSKGGKFGPWKDHFDAMAKKTVLKKLLRTAPQSIELSTALSHDQATIKIDPKNFNGNIPLLESSDTIIEFDEEGTGIAEEKVEAKSKLNDILGTK